MIQRKQTLFLLFSILIMAGYLYAPLIKAEGGGDTHYLYAYSLFFSKNVDFPVIHHYFVLLCLVATGIAMGLNLMTIFLFKFRKAQIVLCWLSIIPLLYAFCYVYYRWSTSESLQDQYFYYGNISPLVAIVFVFLAMFYIRKDDELVKSVDRLR